MVTVSGGFDPIHIGHIYMLQEAKKLGDKLIIILNNDQWLKTKKGQVFMPEAEREEIVRALSCFDEVITIKHPPNSKDMSVCQELKKLKPYIFANAGDRKIDNIPEVVLCHQIGCKMIFNVGRGGKIQSSSWLLENYKLNLPPAKSCWVPGEIVA